MRKYRTINDLPKAARADFQYAMCYHLMEELGEKLFHETIRHDSLNILSNPKKLMQELYIVSDRYNLGNTIAENYYMFYVEILLDDDGVLDELLLEDIEKFKTDTLLVYFFAEADNGERRIRNALEINREIKSPTLVPKNPPPKVHPLSPEAIERKEYFNQKMAEQAEKKAQEQARKDAEWKAEKERKRAKNRAKREAKEKRKAEKAERNRINRLYREKQVSKANKGG